MFRLAKPSDFLRELSESPWLKFGLAWLTFGALVVPTALLMTFGVPEKYALPAMLAAILPFQYLGFCLFRHFRETESERRRGIEQLEAGLDLACEAQLVVLDLLRQSGIPRVAESDLHRMVFEVASLFPVSITFIERPTTYSNDVFMCLRRLERERLVDEFICRHNGRVPRCHYELTEQGQAKASLARERIRKSGIVKLQEFVRSFEAAARKRVLLPQLSN